MKFFYSGRSLQKMSGGFEAMTCAQLREFLDGCHAAREYDWLFDRAREVFNRRFYSDEERNIRDRAMPHE